MYYVLLIFLRFTLQIESLKHRSSSENAIDENDIIAKLRSVAITLGSITRQIK